ncbi:sensor histidine kinase [Nocardia pneumoniae]|uniref:sensor histidine kinase n=1 Tax=Nocardia pneumoniae TaxID=228601 RepID=UPI00278BF51A|nr:histidine kinase [Nocardia pneumoniae]
MRVSAITDRSSVGLDWGVALVVAAVQVVGGTFANMRQTGVHSLDVLGYLLLLAGPVALIWRRAQPVPVLFVVLAVCVAYFVRGYGYGPIFLALVVAFLTAASSGSRWWTYPLVPLGYLTLVWPVPGLLGRPVGLWQIFALMAWLAVLLSVAEGIRQRKAVLVARRQRAEAARRDEEAQRERRASEERLAIARELHDVLAHSLSVINVQSSVALEILDKRPEQAETALTAIKAVSRDALAEVHALLHTIRSGTVAAPAGQPSGDDSAYTDGDTDRRRRRGSRNGRDQAAEHAPRDSADSEPAAANTAAVEPPPAPRTPAPSIGDLDELLQRPRATGLAVETRVLGTPQQLPSVIDAAAARIVQESLTNVLRHAPGADATVTVRYAPDSVDITVDNTRPTSAPSRSGNGGGNGVIGMRERAHALGGALTAGPRPSGGFRVAARLPTRTPEPGATPNTEPRNPATSTTAARDDASRTPDQEAAGPTTATSAATPTGAAPRGTTSAAAPNNPTSSTPGSGATEPAAATPGTTPSGDAAPTSPTVRSCPASAAPEQRTTPGRPQDGPAERPSTSAGHAT